MKKCDRYNSTWRQEWGVTVTHRRLHPPLCIRHFNRQIVAWPALPAAPHPNNVFCRLGPPILRQVLKRWVAAAKEIFIC